MNLHLREWERIDLKTALIVKEAMPKRGDFFLRGKETKLRAFFKSHVPVVSDLQRRADLDGLVGRVVAFKCAKWRNYAQVFMDGRISKKNATEPREPLTWLSGTYPGNGDLAITVEKNGEPLRCPTYAINALIDRLIATAAEFGPVEAHFWYESARQAIMISNPNHGLCEVISSSFEMSRMLTVMLQGAEWRFDYTRLRPCMVMLPIHSVLSFPNAMRYIMGGV